MKKKIIIPIILLIIIVVGAIIFINKKNKIISTILLDINPSIEINLDKDEHVISVIDKNSDAKDIVINTKSNSLEETLDKIADNLINNGYIDNDQLIILVYSKGNINNQKVEDNIRDSFGRKNIHTEIISINEITEEDKKLANKYNISISKASYINSIVNTNQNINIDNLVNKSVRDLNETKQTGRYCSDDYTLEGDWCYKEIARENAKEGNVCPNGYFEENGICYEETPFEDTEELECRDEFNLNDNNCIRILEEEKEPIYYCEHGELKTEGEIRWHNWKGGSACVDASTGKAPTQRCLTINHIMIEGECADGPKPTINGGCEPGDYLVNGGCYTKDNGDQWVCPDGGIYEKSKGTYMDICPDTLTYTKPSIKGYTCHDGFELKNDKCIKEEIESPQKKRICKEGYTKIDNDRCLNLSKTTSKENGYYCEGENTRLKGNICITYEVVEANK